MKHLLTAANESYLTWTKVSISKNRMYYLISEKIIETSRYHPTDWQPLINWCNNNIKGRWDHYWSSRSDGMDFFFRTPSEAIRFKLTWA